VFYVSVFSIEERSKVPARWDGKCQSYFVHVPLLLKPTNNYDFSIVFTTAGKMLNDLAAQDGDNALRRRISHYVKPLLLIIDEVGYLAYSNRHADLLFDAKPDTPKNPMIML